MKTYDVLGVGNALMDICLEAGEKDLRALDLNKGIMHLVDAPRQSTLLDHFDGKKKTTELGGSAMNVIRVLASMGSKTAFVGMVGKDDFGSRILQRLRDLKIAPLLAQTEHPTGSCLVLVTPDGERTMNTHLGSSRLYNESHIPHEEIASAKVFHTEGYQWDTDGQKQAIAEAVATARKNGTQISLDVADPFAVNRSREDFRRLIAEGVDIVFANEEEARLLYDCSPQETARKIAEQGAIAVIKLGADGAIIRRGNEEHHVPAAAVAEVVDTNGAGDIFASGFLYGYVSGRALPDCGKIATTLAADVISRVGVSVSDKALAQARSL